MLRLMIGAAMISFSGVFVKLVSVGPTTSAFYRCLVGGVVLAVLIIAKGERLLRSRKAMLGLFIAAVFFTLDLGVWHQSILYIGPGMSTLLANSQVFILGFIGLVFLGDRFRWEFAISIPMGFAGLALMILPDWSAQTDSYHVGIALALLTAVFYSGYLLSLRRVRHKSVGESASADLALVSLFSAALLAPAVLTTGESLAVPSLTDAGLLAAYGVVSQVVGWVLISSSLGRMPASRVGLVLLLQPLLAFVWDVLFFGRGLTILEVAGGLVTLTAIYLGARR
ncbi:MAG: DMT family transporter [Gammaproteobacteria bacterium]